MVSTPKPPPAPDPVATAAAQTQMNKETAISQAGLNAMNQYGPNGSLTYSQNGTWSDGTPKFSATQTLSPAETALNNLSNATQINLGQLGVDQSGRLSDLLSQPYDISQGAINSRTSGMPGLPSLSTQQLFLTDPSSFSTNSKPFQTNATPYLTDPNAPGARYTDPGSVSPRYTDPTMVGVQYADTTAPTARYTDATGPALRAIVDPTLVSRQNIDSNDQLTNQLFAAGRQRLDPVLANARDNAEATLANKGLTAGSTGYERGMLDVSQKENDAYNQLFLTGQQQAFDQSATRANTTFGQDLSRFGQFFNESAQKSDQEFQQDLASRGFTLGANNQNFAQDLAGRTYTRDTTNSNFGQAVQVANTARAANESNFQQALGAAGFGMSANNQNFQQDLTRSGYTAGINAQNFGQILGANGQNFSQLLGSNGQNFSQLLGSNNANFGQVQAANDQSYQQQLSNYQAAMAQRAAALQEIQAGRNQPLNEIAALLSGSQVTPQNFVSTPQTQVAPTNYTGLVSDIYKGQIAGYQAQNQARSSMFSGLGSIFGTVGSLVGASDIRLKRDIRPAGRLSNGLSLYEYRFGDGPMTVGVMAQEVAHVRPDAVMIMPGGWLAVDYARALEA